MRTERLVIRPIEKADWQSIQAIWRDFNRSDYVQYDNEKSTEDEDVRQRIGRWVTAAGDGHDHIFYAVCRGDTVIGYVALNARDGGYELGYGFREEYQGCGYAKESLTAVFAEMKEMGVEKIYAGTALKNTPSVRLLKSLHFEQRGTERRSFLKDQNGKDIWFDGGIFELTL